MAITWDGSQFAFYVDGQSQGTHQIGTVHASADFTGIGARLAQHGSWWTYHFDGEIDEVLFFGRGLSATEIQSVYGASRKGVCKS